MTEIPTQGEDWSLNEEGDGTEHPGRRFWWNKTYSISVWENHLASLPHSGSDNKNEEGRKKAKALVKKLTDFDVWRAYIKFQVGLVYKLCSICNGPETAQDLKICCYCGNSVCQVSCSGPAAADQIAWKPANKGFERYLCVCLACDDKMPEKTKEIKMHEDDARRGAIRTLAVKDELGPALAARCTALVMESEHHVKARSEKAMMDEVQNINREFFQPGNSAQLLERRPVASKGGGVGVWAKTNIPRFTIVGVYPGYEDPLSGEHAKVDRPGPKYSLVDLNCADYFNRVFVEFDKCFTPFINEPNETEEANTAWIQETIHKDGRLSVMAVRDIKAGEELLIGYGPLYPRTYPFRYDAWALHTVEGYTDPPCFALWRWKSKEEEDAEFICYCEYVKDKNQYVYWQTEDEAEADKKKKAKAATASLAAFVEGDGAAGTTTAASSSSSSSSATASSHGQQQQQQQQSKKASTTNSGALGDV